MDQTTQAEWTLDGEPVEDIREFIRDNGLSEDEEAAVLALRVGEAMTFGGGAGAEFVLERRA